MRPAPLLDDCQPTPPQADVHATPARQVVCSMRTTSTSAIGRRTSGQPRPRVRLRVERLFQCRELAHPASPEASSPVDRRPTPTPPNIGDRGWHRKSPRPRARRPPGGPRALRPVRRIWFRARDPPPRWPTLFRVAPAAPGADNRPPGDFGFDINRDGAMSCHAPVRLRETNFGLFFGVEPVERSPFLNDGGAETGSARPPSPRRKVERRHDCP